jgi:hypothetical protein
LAIVLSVFIFWPLSCLSLSFGHCLVCLYLLVINGQKKKTDKTMAKRKRQTRQWPKDKDKQDNDQKIKTDKTMAKR